ncbi:Os08g0358800 [Oryza sativa Japonica Group]|uniref:Os08g0358800 protein n=3 Tax=Oryza TaxID=4527 RepID=A0A0P0XEU2_ORYSJ|nr:hypothetical protein OsJ_27037 [Oryza sativa Japonica Group]KAB8108238.1 hypothetical protein EE612_043731 [Oryza sativa]BAD03775.1 putative response regulator [Oryza sativa Japonica Group]BAH94264.1 Os08g0358800 [Oryza sativa Japonica Group]BAT05087.1 Os08g0358800 [Oryza sativa Japonica Group]|eukprot:NP_001175536.1 Os08g0358800 [Oryza sativa Japonica Group]
MIEIIDLSQYIGPELDKKKAKLEKAKSKLLELEKKADIEENTRVTAVESVMQALVFLDSEHDVNMIVSDYCMPEMTGYDLLMEVKKSPRLVHLPVIIASSDNIPERIRKCFDGGAKDYILKPVKIADVPRILNYI